jgi:hypothetical protein
MTMVEHFYKLGKLFFLPTIKNIFCVIKFSSEQNIHHQQEIQATPESNEPENSNDIILSSAEHSVSSPVANDHLKAMQKMCTVEQTPRLKPTQIFNKHQCQCCCKVFSSSSALQIHRRTHTGMWFVYCSHIFYYIYATYYHNKFR